MRPIVTNINSPTYALAKKLAQIISPLTGNTETYIQNSTHFIQKIKQMNIEDSDKMISFDVESLFTKVPIKETLKILLTKLENDDHLSEKITLPAKEICALTELCVTSYVFLFSK